MKKKNFILVLHAHLPYVLNHGTWPHGTDWLFEAAAETYIPLLKALDNLYNDGIPSPITINITPILLEQFAAPEFKEGFKDYLKNKLKHVYDDSIYFKKTNQKVYGELSNFWEDFYKGTLEYFIGINENLIGEFKKAQDRGQIEIITCCATHGYLPLLGNDEAVNGQVSTAVNTYKSYFKKKPLGIWLPENAYRPSYIWKSPLGGRGFKRKGVEEILSRNDIRYFFVDTHLIRNSKAKGVYLERFKALQVLWDQFKKGMAKRDLLTSEFPEHSYYLVHEHNEKPVYALIRDEKTGSQVWSAQNGYPGDGNYLEFHKKKFPGGHKYWKVTGNNVSLGDKLEYDPAIALERAQSHAEHFVSLLENIAGAIKDKDSNGIVALYDAELFGHWWFEGIKWIENVFRCLASSKTVKGEMAHKHIETNRPFGKISLPEGSWGEGGFHYIWLNDWTKWTWKYIYEAEETLRKAVKTRNAGNAFENRILIQMARELLLLESSDWQFLISTWSARDYAENRVTFHYENFVKVAALYGKYKGKKKMEDPDRSYLEHLEKIDGVFKNIDLSAWEKE